MLFTGRASISMDARSITDPWHLLAPTKVLQGWFGVFDFDLYHGRVVKDYLAEGAVWNDTALSAAATP
jgi:hypothetical protein